MTRYVAGVTVELYWASAFGLLELALGAAVVLPPWKSVGSDTWFQAPGVLRKFGLQSSMICPGYPTRSIRTASASTGPLASSVTFTASVEPVIVKLPKSCHAEEPSTKPAE